MRIMFKGRQLLDIQINDIDPKDYPDFCDAYIASAIWGDTGTELTEDEIEEVNEDRDLVHNAVHCYLF